MSTHKMNINKNLCFFFIFIIYGLLIFNPHYQSEARLIRGSIVITPDSPLYNFASFLYRNFGERKFSIEDVQNVLTADWSQPMVYSRMRFLKNVGILKIEQGRPNYYQIAEEFYGLENFELLAGIRELHAKANANVDSAFIFLVKEKIRAILEAKENLVIDISTNFQGKEKQLRQKLLISLSYYGLLDFIKSFSYIRVEKGSYNVSYNNRDNSLTLQIRGGYELSQEVPTLFYFRDSPLRKNLASSIIASTIELERFARDVEYLEYLEITLGEILKGINRIARAIYGTRLYYASELVERFPLLDLKIPHNPYEYGLSLTEAFISKRNDRDFQALYLTFLALQEKIAEDIMKGLNSLGFRRKYILYLRYFKGLTHEAIGERFYISRERVRQLEGEALHKLKTIIPGLFSMDRIEEIFEKVFSILYGEGS